MEGPYGITALWAQSDGVIKTVAICLLLMSVASWSVITIKAVKLFRLQRCALKVNGFWHFKDIHTEIKHLDTRSGHPTPFSQLVNEGLNAKAHYQQHKNELHGDLNLTHWLTTCLRHSIDGSKAELQRGLAILASVGATAPFIGLLGTVWGIYHALINIGISGQASIDKVAGPVGEALIMTAFGLAVAIPAVLGYNALTRGNTQVIERLNFFAHEVHAYLVIGSAPSKTAHQLKVVGE
ncbi:MotA/TolQ/ExbB proton channel family protein [Pseudoalteromonas sp. S1727]|uniref:MotA/TolQ/ExbB proton channel family protein n=1 Tax=Pseudoalteromonas sp. S1727 TaxID=2066514 RepID=UPI001107ADF6|nr:MotA/TolQ/ExbB proton channel family protein [Pseudoalteromonas sp. S1727]TMN68200.1 MotA/TolQ/ExbB proton channel family protein [Pseudoalteromonas sp. S1727]